MKKHDIVIALVGLTVVMLLLVSSCDLGSTDTDDTNASVDSNDLNYNPEKSDREVLRKVLSNEGKDTSDVPPPPSAG